MRLTQTATLLIGTGLITLLSGCSSPDGVRVTHGDQPTVNTTANATTPRSGATSSSDSTIVHVDMFARVATIRNGSNLPTDFLIVTNRNGEQTGILKARSMRATGLRTADILEGEPRINHTITPASPAESDRLSKIYRDGSAE